MYHASHIEILESQHQIVKSFLKQCQNKLINIFPNAYDSLQTNVVDLVIQTTKY